MSFQTDKKAEKQQAGLNSREHSPVPGKRTRVSQRYGASKRAKTAEGTEAFCPMPESASPDAAFGSSIGQHFGGGAGAQAEEPIRQSLGRGGASTCSDRDLSLSMAAAREDLGGMTSGSVDADEQERNLSILQWEASERGVEETAPPVDAATAVTLPGGLLLSASAAHLGALRSREPGGTRARAYRRVLGAVSKARLSHGVVDP